MFQGYWITTLLYGGIGVLLEQDRVARAVGRQVDAVLPGILSQSGGGVARVQLQLGPDSIEKISRGWKVNFEK